MADNKVIDTFMKTVLDSYTQTSLKNVDTENIRNTSAAHSMTSGYNEKDREALSASYGNLVPDAGAMKEAITQGNRLLTLTKQISSISKSAGASEEESINIRSKISKDMLDHANKQLTAINKTFEANKVVTESYKEQLKAKIDLISLNKDMLKEEKSLSDSTKATLKDQIKVQEELKKQLELEVKKALIIQEASKADKTHYETLVKNTTAEQKTLDIIKSQLVTAKGLTKAQLVVDVARGKTTMKDAALGTLINGGGIKDVASMGMQVAKLKAGINMFGEHGLALLAQSKTMKKEGAAMIAKGDVAGGTERAAQGQSLQTTAIILGAAHGFATIVVNAGALLAKGILMTINMVTQSFSGGISGLMHSMVDIIAAGMKFAVTNAVIVGGSVATAGFGAFSAGLATAAQNAGLVVSDIIKAAGDLVIQVKLFNLEQSSQHNKQKWAIAGRTGVSEQTAYKNLDNRGLPPGMMSPWITSLAQQGISDNNQRNKIMDIGAPMGMDSGETAQNFQAMRESSLSANEAIKNMSISFRSAKDSAKDTGLATTIFTSAINKAAVAARYMQVDLKQVVGLSNKLASNEGGFAAAGLNIQTDLEGILTSLSTVGKDWSSPLHAFAGQQIYGGAYKGDVLGGMYASEMGKPAADNIINNGWEGIVRTGKDHTSFKSDANVQNLEVAARAAAEASKGSTGAAKLKKEEEVYKMFNIKDRYIMSLGNDALDKSNKTGEAFKLSEEATKDLNNTQKSAVEILTEQNQLEVKNYALQKYIAASVGGIFEKLKNGDVSEAADSMISLTGGLADKFIMEASDIGGSGATPPGINYGSSKGGKGKGNSKDTRKKDYLKKTGLEAKWEGIKDGMPSKKGVTSDVNHAVIGDDFGNLFDDPSIENLKRALVPDAILQMQGYKFNDNGQNLGKDKVIVIENNMYLDGNIVYKNQIKHTEKRK